MRVNKIENISITFSSDELYNLAYAIYNNLSRNVNSHIINLCNNEKDDYETREQLFIEQHGKDLKMMVEFFALSGYLDIGNYLKEKLEKAVHNKEEVE